MLTQEQIIEQIKTGRSSECLDGRDYSRLSDFFAPEQWEVLGISIKEGAVLSELPKPKEWNRDNVISQLAEDVAFGFEKALSKRGISSGMMFNVVEMWMWVLEDELLEGAEDRYAQYGLPFFKEVALKYGFPNEIGEDAGDEFKYAAEGML